MRNARPTTAGRRSRRLSLAALLAFVVFAISACQAGPGAPSTLQPGYKYYDFALSNQPIENWTSGATSVVVQTAIGNAGDLVYVQLLCNGAVVRTGSTYVFRDSDNVSASATLANMGASTATGCVYREHIPNDWPVPTIEVGASHAVGGAIISIGAIISNF